MESFTSRIRIQNKFKLTHIYLNTLIRTYLQQIKKLFTVKTPPVELQDRTDIQEVHSVNPILTFK